MARTRRLKYHGDDVYYHLMSKTVGGEFYLGSEEKNHLMSLISHYSSIYFVKLIGFCIMDNHFHIIVKSEDVSDYDSDEVSMRINSITNGKTLTHLKKLEIADKLGNISEYMKSIKENFSRWYNKRNNRCGYFWGDRFKSVLLEKKCALTHCLAYIDLNPVRAKLVNRPEDYRWSSIYARVNRTEIFKKLYFIGIFDEYKIEFKRALALYRKFMYAVGCIKKERKGVISLGAVENEFGLNSDQKMVGRVAHFSQSAAVGSKGFVSKIYGLFAGKGIYKKDRKSYEIPISKEIVSLSRLKSINA